MNRNLISKRHRNKKQKAPQIWNRWGIWGVFEFMGLLLEVFLNGLGNL